MKKQPSFRYFFYCICISILGISKESNGSAFFQPPSVVCNNTIVEMAVVQSTLTIAGALSFSTRLYSYQGVTSHPGPTIHLIPGNNCTIRIRNELSNTSSVATCDYHENTFHCPDSTNLHTHVMFIAMSDSR